MSQSAVKCSTTELYPQGDNLDWMLWSLSKLFLLYCLYLNNTLCTATFDFALFSEDMISIKYLFRKYDEESITDRSFCWHFIIQYFSTICSVSPNLNNKLLFELFSLLQINSKEVPYYLV